LAEKVISLSCGLVIGHCIGKTFLVKHFVKLCIEMIVVSEYFWQRGINQFLQY